MLLPSCCNGIYVVAIADFDMVVYFTVYFATIVIVVEMTLFEVVYVVEVDA